MRTRYRRVQSGGWVGTWKTPASNSTSSSSLHTLLIPMLFASLKGCRGTGWPMLISFSKLHRYSGIFQIHASSATIWGCKMLPKNFRFLWDKWIKISGEIKMNYMETSVCKSSLRTGKRPQMDRTGPEKNRTAVLVFDISKSKTAKRPVFLDQFRPVTCTP